MSKESLSEVWAQAFDRLRSLNSSHRLRRDIVCDIPDKASSAHRQVDDKTMVDFCSNDYLDLALHPAVKQGAKDAVDAYGTGSMASRLLCGTLPIHQELESALASLKGTEAALVYSSGYMSCLGAVQVLSRRADDSRVPILFDRLAHASLVDAATHGQRGWRTFPHNNLDSLELLLKKITVTDWPSALVVTEGVFSMDGDVAPLKAMSEMCARYHAILVVDDAHGTCTMGEAGAGSVAAAGIADQPHVVQIGTLSKALGSQGGFVAGPQVLRDLMVNTARTFIFDTGLAPAACGAALAALKVAKAEPERLVKLRDNISLFRRLMNRTACAGEEDSPIFPLLLRGEEQTINAAKKLRDEGFMVGAIRPPTVPEGTCRLRITMSSAQGEKDIRALSRALSDIETG